MYERSSGVTCSRTQRCSYILRGVMSDNEMSADCEMAPPLHQNQGQRHTQGLQGHLPGQRHVRLGTRPPHVVSMVTADACFGAVKRSGGWRRLCRTLHRFSAGRARITLKGNPMAILDNDVLLENLQDLEEVPEKVRSPCEGKWEEVLTDSLLEISEKILYDDQKSTELIIGTGWEEAVCGWGPVSATACMYPVKKPKKLKQVEATDCLLCLGLYSVPDNKDGTSSETKDTIHINHKVMPGAEQRLVSTIPAEEDLPSEFTDHCSSTAMVSTTETHCDTVNLVSPGEQRQNKDKNAQRISSPFTGKAIPICKNCYNVNELPILSTPMLLPPLKATAGIGYAEHMARRKDFLMQQLEKLPSKGSVRGNLNGHILSNTDLKAERRLLEALTELPQEQLKVPEHLSFITSCIPKTPIKELDRFQWSRSPVEQRLNAQPSIKQNINSAPIGFLHTKTMQNKRNVRQEVRPINDARYRRAKSDTTPVVRNTILPSLTVKRVDIPLKIKLC